MKYNRVEIVNLSGGLIGLLGTNPAKAVNARIQLLAADGWHCHQIITHSTRNIYSISSVIDPGMHYRTVDVWSRIYAPYGKRSSGRQYSRATKQESRDGNPSPLSLFKQIESVLQTPLVSPCETGAFSFDLMVIHPDRPARPDLRGPGDRYPGVACPSPARR